MDAIFPSTEDVLARLDAFIKLFYECVTAGFYCTKPVHIKNSLSYPHDGHHAAFSVHCSG